MRKFVEDERLVSSVREKLLELFNQQGREVMREELMRYCREVLGTAIAELKEDDLARHQLEIELAEMNEALEEFKPSVGILKLSR